MDDLQRFLDLVRRELSCDDARFEFGGTGSTEASHVKAEIPGGWRVVALWSKSPREGPASAGERGFSDRSSREGPASAGERGFSDKSSREGPASAGERGFSDRSSREGDRGHAQAKLEALVQAFASVAEQLRLRSPRMVSHTATRELDDALALLAEKADALRAVVIDEDSPVLWGTSEPSAGPEDVEVAMWTGELADSAAAAELDIVELVGLDDVTLRERLAGVEPRKLRERLQRKLPVVRELGAHRDAEGWLAHFATCRAIAAVRRAPERHEAIEDELGWLARDFGGIYHVILVYGGPFDEIGAARMMLRALPAIEKLVLSLPPIDPAPKGARVLAFKRPS